MCVCVCVCVCAESVPVQPRCWTLASLVYRNIASDPPPPPGFGPGTTDKMLSGETPVGDRERVYVYVQGGGEGGGGCTNKCTKLLYMCDLCLACAPARSFTRSLAGCLSFAVFPASFSHCHFC